MVDDDRSRGIRRREFLLSSATGGLLLATGQQRARGEAVAETAGGSAHESPFETIAFEGAELSVTVRDSLTVSRVEAVQGEKVVGEVDLTPSTSTATVFTARRTIRDGTFELVAYGRNGDQLGSVTKTFSASMWPTRIRSRATEAGSTEARQPVEQADDSVAERQTAMVRIENLGTAPLFLPLWDVDGRVGVGAYLTRGVPTPSDPREAAAATRRGQVVVPPGESVEVPCFPGEAGGAFLFDASNCGPNDWPTQIEKMGEFPDGYANGDTLAVDLFVKDDQREIVARTFLAEYSGGLVQTESDEYAPHRVDSGVQMLVHSTSSTTVLPES